MQAVGLTVHQDLVSPGDHDAGAFIGLAHRSQVIADALQDVLRCHRAACERDKTIRGQSHCLVAAKSLANEIGLVHLDRQGVHLLEPAQKRLVAAGDGAVSRHEQAVC